MSLRRKSLLIIFSTLAVLVLLLAISANMVLTRSFSALEEQDVMDDMARAAEALTGRLNQIQQTATDYAYWDNFYEYAGGNDPSFPENELGGATVARLNLNLVYIVDENGQERFQRAVRPMTGEPDVFPAGLTRTLADHPDLLVQAQSASGLLGLLRLPEGTLMLAGAPVLTSEGTGPARGALLMGRFLDADELAGISQAVHLELEQYIFSSGDLPEAVRPLKDSLASGPGVSSRPLNSSTVTGGLRVDDLTGQPAVLITASQPRHLFSQGRTALVTLLSALVAAGVIFGAVIYRLISSLVVRRVAALSGVAQRVAAGETGLEVPVSGGNDEISVLEEAFRATAGYLTEAAGTAGAISAGNLQVQVSARSAQDALGQALAGMLSRLRGLLGQITHQTAELHSAAEELAYNAEQTGLSTTQVAATLQQITTGITQQSLSTTRTAESIDLMGRLIAGIVAGTQEQSQAVGQVSVLTSQISAGTAQVSQSAQSMSADAAAAAQAARGGTQAVERTVQGMDRIRAQVGLSAERVEALGRRSDQIDSIAQTIGQIASQTNLLALNAAIEAARAGGKTSQMTTELLRSQLAASASLLAEVDCRAASELTSADLNDLAARARVDTLLVTDSDGVIRQSNDASIIGYRFSDDPKEQSYQFRALLKQRDGLVTQPVQPRSRDGMPYMWVGVSRRRSPGIIQAGMTAEAIQRNADYSQGFAVVADEVRKLADQAGAAAKEIGALLGQVQAGVRDSIAAMEDSRREILSGVDTTQKAGEVLADLLNTSEGTLRQAEEVSRAAARIQESARALVSAVDVVGGVAEKNQAAAQSIRASVEEVSGAMENIASISEENSAAVEEVSAATSEMAQQAGVVAHAVSSLQEMAARLRGIMGEFQID